MAIIIKTNKQNCVICLTEQTFVDNICQSCNNPQIDDLLKSEIQTMQETLQNYVLEQIFCEYPTDHYNALGKWNAFDFFLSADVDCTEDVSSSPLSTEWGYEVCQAYELDNVRNIRGLMQSIYSDLEGLKNIIVKHHIKPVKVTLDDFEVPNRFYDFIQEADAKLYDQGLETEHAIVFAATKEVVS